MISCSSCEESWTASSYAHCSVCHDTFITVEFFDWHRVDGACYGTKKGVSVRHRALKKVDGVVGTPSAHEQREILSTRMEVARSARGKKPPSSG